MGFCVCGGAMMMCSFGAAPSTLMVLPEKRVVTSMPIATIEDSKPMENIMPFGMCTSPSNPQVAAAMGSPMPCMPVTVAPWAPGAPTVLIGGTPALNQSSTLTCNWGGVIQITSPGTTTIEVP